MSHTHVLHVATSHHSFQSMQNKNKHEKKNDGKINNKRMFGVKKRGEKGDSLYLFLKASLCE